VADTFPSPEVEVSEGEPLRDPPAFSDVERHDKGDGTPFACARVTFVPKIFERTYPGLSLAEADAITTFYDNNKTSWFWWRDYRRSVFWKVTFAEEPVPELRNSCLYRCPVRLRQYGSTSYVVRPTTRHFKCNDNAASTVVVDSSISAVNGAMVGGNTSAFSAAGKLATCFDLDGSTAAVDCGDEAAWQSQTFSIAAWVATSSAAEQCLAATYDGTYHGWFLRRGDFYVFFSLAIYGTITLSIPTDGAWHHVCVTYDGAVIRAYVDGVALTPVAYTGGVGPTTIDPFLGRYAHGTVGYLDGKLDDVRFYDFALSAAEITAIYNSGSGSETV
jgi:hypothetical protein